jgi:hypothetical protein
MEFAEGQRVRVRQDPDYPRGPWPDEPIGWITDFGDGVLYRDVATPKGARRTWFVTFEEPQRDVDGPYRSSEVLEKYLEAVS